MSEGDLERWRRRLEASKELLKTKDATVAETAVAVGFATPQSFARAFRRHTGMKPWAEATDVLKRLEGIYGIPLDDSASVPLDRLRYDACLALGVTTAPEPLRVLALPAGDYARLRHLGSYEALEATTQNLVGDWLPASGREPANFPVLHHFISDPDATPVEELVTDILLPLASSQESSRD